MEASFGDKEYEAAVKELDAKVAKFPDFPKKGVLFYDLFSLLYDAHLRDLVIKTFMYVIKKHFTGKYDVIGGLEARGLMLGFHLAELLHMPFVPLRKPGKLPGECIKTTFTKEYGSDAFEVQKHMIKPGTRVLIIDDLLATGGSMAACDDLIEKCGGTIAGYVVIFYLVILMVRKSLSIPQK